MSNDLRKRKKDTTPYKTNFRRYKSYVEITCLRVSARISFLDKSVWMRRKLHLSCELPTPSNRATSRNATFDKRAFRFSQIPLRKTKRLSSHKCKHFAHDSIKHQAYSIRERINRRR